MFTMALAALSLVSPLELLASPSEADVRAHIRAWEGYRLKPYTDPNGSVQCVGIGHNLTAHKERVKALYTDSEVLALFHRDYIEAVRAARRSIHNYDVLPDNIQTIVIGMVFTLGPTGFYRWKTFRQALSNRLYTSAGKELLNSRWARQVGERRSTVYWGTLVQVSP